MQGQVIDYDTTIPIAFAKITYQNKIIYSNWEGKFTLEVSDVGKPIFVSYKGYHDKSHYLNVGAKTILIKMVSNNTKQNAEIYSDNLTNLIVK